jgi:hypothetical protein
MIYGLLSIAGLKDIPLVPDYDKSISEVYTDFAVKWIKTKLDVSIISFGGIGILGDEFPLDTPSWVPDFRSGIRHGRTMTLQKFRASRECKGAFDFSSNFRTLHCDGVVVDEISLRRPYEPWPKSSWQDLVLSCADIPHPTGISHYQAFFWTSLDYNWELVFEQKGPQRPNIHPGFFDDAAAFMRMLGEERIIRRRNEDILRRRNGSREEDGNDYSIFCERLEQFGHFHPASTEFAKYFTVWRCPSLDFLEDGIPSIGEMLEPFLATSRPDRKLQWPSPYDPANVCGNALNWASEFEGLAKHRSFFFSSKGYMGLGPPDLQVGDKICVVLGCDKPIVIRPKGDNYLVVGKCLVYGLMNGEIIEEVEEGRMKVESLHFE